MDQNRLESYARAFGVEDEDLDTILTAGVRGDAFESYIFKVHLILFFFLNLNFRRSESYG